MEKLFYTVGEVAGILGENSSAVRYWSNSFSRYLHPTRNGKGDRRFTKEDVETFKRIHFLLKSQGMTLERGGQGSRRRQKSGVDRNVKYSMSLRNMREQLQNIVKRCKNCVIKRFNLQVLKKIPYLCRSHIMRKADSKQNNLHIDMATKKATESRYTY